MLDTLKEVFNEIDNLDREKVMELMRKVINIDTSVPPGDKYREFLDIIKPDFEKLGLSCEEVIVPEELIKEIPLALEGPRINLVATKDFGQNDYVSFYAHMDVVPAPKEGWKFDPFEATMIKSGKIFGRGVADMKGAIPCLIMALQFIEQFNLTPKFNIRVLLCTDEEIGIWPGVRYLKEKGYVKGIVYNMDAVNSPIIPVGSGGDLDVVIETHGQSCHSGVNFMGVNALEEMIPIMNELIALKRIVEERESNDIPGFPRPGTGEMRNMFPMFNLDIIRAGEKANIVPDLCTLTVNRRFIPDEKVEDVKQEILEAIERGKAKSKALEVKTYFMYNYPAVRIDPSSPASTRMKKVLSLVQNIPEEKILTIGMSGSTDMGFLTDHDMVIRGVGSAGSKQHGVNENIRLRDVKLFIKEIISFLCIEL